MVRRGPVPPSTSPRARAIVTFSAFCIHCGQVMLSHVPQIANDEIGTLRQHLRLCDRAAFEAQDTDPATLGALLRHFEVIAVPQRRA